MELRILGSDGGASLHHRNVSLLVDGRLALDAGSLAGALDLDEQRRIEQVLLSHAHMDHVADLGAMTDVRAQQGGPTLPIAALRETIEALEAHYFNDVLWPDFRRIPAGNGPTVELRALEPERVVDVLGFRVRPVPVSHTVPSCAYVVDDGSVALAYTGDTGPTRRVWEVLREEPNLRALVTEVSYPDRMADLARDSGHLTPSSFREQVARLGAREGVDVLVYGLKPFYAEEIEAELRERGGDVRILASGDRFAW